MKKKVIWVLLAVMLVMISSYALILGNQKVEVELYRVKRGTIENFIEETGIVRTEGDMNIYAAVYGKVKEMKADVGDRVRIGDLLVIIDDEELILKKKALEAQKEFLMAQYRESSQPMEGDLIRKLELQLESSLDALEETRRLAENSKKLYEEGALSLEDYRRAVIHLSSQEASTEALKIDLERAKRGVSSHIQQQYEAQIRQVQLQIDELIAKRKEYHVVAPTEGVIMMRTVEKGSYLHPGMLMMEIGDPHHLYVEADILVSEIGEVVEGAEVFLSNEEVGLFSSKGYVEKIEPKAFSKMSDLGIDQKRVRVKIAFHQDSIKNLRPGYEVDVKIVTVQKQNILLIPIEAVLEIEGKDYVYVNQNGSVQLREIKKGIEGKNQIEVVEGLKEGEEIIASGKEKIKEGMKVKEQKKRKGES